MAPRSAPREDTAFCPSATCGWAGIRLSGHYRHSPHCRPVEAETNLRDSDASYNLFNIRVQSLLAERMWDAHTSHFIRVAHLEVLRVLIISVVALVIAFLIMEVRAESATSEGLTLDKVLHLCDRILQTFKSTPSAEAQCSDQMSRWLSVDPRLRKSAALPAGAPSDGKKHCVTFSFVQLITVMLWESKRIRTEFLKSNKLWKSGELHGVHPEVLGDVTHARRFRNSDTCRKATALEANDLRSDWCLWNDAFTSVGGLSTKAKENKWEVLLACSLNLPLHMRHYFDHILLLALFGAKWGTENGGIVRVRAPHAPFLCMCVRADVGHLEIIREQGHHISAHIHALLSLSLSSRSYTRETDCLALNAWKGTLRH